MALNTPFSTGQVLTADLQNNLPFGIVASAIVTSSQTGIGAEVDLTGLTVTFTAVTSRQYLAVITCHPYGTDQDTSDIFINVGGTNKLTVRQTFAATNKIMTQTAQYLFTASSGSTTVKLRMAKSGTNNVNNYGDGNFISTLAVYDLGAR